MVIKINNTYYSVNDAKYTGSDQMIANKVALEIMKRMDLRSVPRQDRSKIRLKIINRYFEAKSS